MIAKKEILHQNMVYSYKRQRTYDDANCVERSNEDGYFNNYPPKEPEWVVNHLAFLEENLRLFPTPQCGTSQSLPVCTATAGPGNDPFTQIKTRYPKPLMSESDAADYVLRREELVLGYRAILKMYRHKMEDYPYGTLLVFENGCLMKSMPISSPGWIPHVQKKGLWVKRPECSQDGQAKRSFLWVPKNAKDHASPGFVNWIAGVSDRMPWLAGVGWRGRIGSRVASILSVGRRPAANIVSQPRVLYPLAGIWYM